LPEAPTIRTIPGGVRLRVNLTPKAAATRIQGTRPDAAGEVMLKASVTAAPEDGKANAALVELLGRLLKLPQRDIRITGGLTARQKVVEIAGDPAALAAAIAQLVGAA
jgi:uncharacterized protein